MKKGYIHIYEGNGKGKTTAAVGLAVRCAGSGGKVVFSQFLKGNSSGELKSLALIPNIQIVPAQKDLGFVFRMNEEQRQEAHAYNSSHFTHVVECSKTADLLILDELIDAWNLEMVNPDEVLAFLRSKRESLEVVMTGRNPDPELVKLADYHTHMEKRKHPFDHGTLARKGIEF